MVSVRHLGDVLVETGRIDEEQLEEAKRAQVLNGGRLGTCLVELGHVDLDTLTINEGVPEATTLMIRV